MPFCCYIFVLLSARIMMIDTYTQKAQVFCGYVSWPKMRKKDEKLPTAKCCTDCNLWASLLPVLLQKPRSIYEKNCWPTVASQWFANWFEVSDLQIGMYFDFFVQNFPDLCFFPIKNSTCELLKIQCVLKKSSIFFNPSLPSIDPGRLTAWTWE